MSYLPGRQKSGIKGINTVGIRPLPSNLIIKPKVEEEKAVKLAEQLVDVLEDSPVVASNNKTAYEKRLENLAKARAAKIAKGSISVSTSEPKVVRKTRGTGKAKARDARIKEATDKSGPEIAKVMEHKNKTKKQLANDYGLNSAAELNKAAILSGVAPKINKKNK